MSQQSLPPALTGWTVAQAIGKTGSDRLEAEGGNKAMAARQLGISEKSIYNKLRRFDLFDQYKK